jgi:amino acid transporter
VKKDAEASPRNALQASWRVLVGEPLRFAEAAKEQITPVEGLSALSLDALTSVAYGPEAIIVVLALAGMGALHLVLPITIAIIILLVLLVTSYRQVIDAYPGGGGAYAVSKANLGRRVSLVAGASLIVDYTLTVAVSVSAGIESLVSAYPSLAPYTIELCLGTLALVTVMNLRGLGEGARAFLLPTLLFIVGLLVVIVIGLIHPLAPHLHQPGKSLLPTTGVETVGVVLVLKAFAAGCSALTGVEAIANGTPLFKEPRVKRAKRTEMLLGLILGVMLLGLAILAVRFHVGPHSTQTVLSQIMGYSIGRNWFYYGVSITITIALALAANTSFGGLPVLASLLARDNFLPHAFSLRGDRLVFSHGIWVLALMSGGLLIAVNGNTIELIPMYAIGVFIGFTLAQSGLVVHWWRGRPPRWRARATLNGIGAIVTGASTIIFLLAKFTEGAWLVVIAIPAFILLFYRINTYYKGIGSELRLGEIPPPPEMKNTLAIVPIVSMSLLTRQAVSEALSMAEEVVCVTVELEEPEPEEAAGGPSRRREELTRLWNEWHPGVPLVFLTTQYSSVVRPIVQYIDKVRKERDDQILVLIPFVVPDHFRHRALHNQLDVALASALRLRTDIVVARVPLRISQVTSNASAAAAELEQPADQP